MTRDLTAVECEIIQMHQWIGCVGIALCCLPLLAVAQTRAVEEPPVAEEIVLTFRLHAPGIPEDTTVFITGSVPGLGNWKPEEVRMKYVGSQVWTHALRNPPVGSLEYKYTQGSWEREGATADGRPLPNFVVAATASSVKRDEILVWTDGQTGNIRGQVTGQVKYHRQMKGDDVRPRDILVWLPPGYDKSNARYPVLYMQDGQNSVDPRTSAFGTDWEIDETCTRLIGAGCIEPLIVVGIYNTVDRSREYLPGATGAAYMNFVIKTLKPFVDRNYRTKPSRTQTFTGGSSAGALCAFMLVWEHSEIFSKAICMSPAFKSPSADDARNLDYVTRVRESDRPGDPVFFYLDNGDVGVDELLQPGIDQMLEVLNAKGYQSGRDYCWFSAADDRHSESAWAKRFPQALQSLLSGDCSVR
jgi:predicted alpha/beta superfamily hydrolase